LYLTSSHSGIEQITFRIVGDQHHFDGSSADGAGIEFQVVGCNSEVDPVTGKRTFHLLV
jgi:hypothetical protein